MNLEQAQQLEGQYFMTLFSRTPLLLERGEGMYVWDDQGRRYLDFCSGGRAVNALGHCHPKVVAAICAQAGTLLHTSNDYFTEPQERLAELLVTHSALDRAMFCNSGAEAIEAAIKLARKFGKRDSAGRVEIVSTWKSFHGRTMGAITATGQPKYQQGFEPLLPGFRYVDFNDLAAMDAVVSDRTCAVLLEPVQGESGVYPATPEYLRGVNSIVILRSLMIRGLVERFPDPAHASSFLYRGTFDLMKHLGIKEKGDLPDYEKFQELLKVFDQTGSEKNGQ